MKLLNLLNKVLIICGLIVSILINPLSTFSKDGPGKKRIGIIGLDTSHSIEFTRLLNDPAAGSTFKGYKVVFAYPWGSRDIESSAKRIPGITEEIKKFNVKIASSISELLENVDVVLLETNDGRLHLEQAIQVINARKPLFIDKPLAASLKDVITIFRKAEESKVPVFSSSALRYILGAEEAREGKMGKITGANVFSPAYLEKSHPDLFWYGIHGVEMLFTIMGTGCSYVSCIHNAETDVVTGVWKDGRVGVFRGMRSGAEGYGGTIFGDKGAVQLGRYMGYKPLLLEIVSFFNTGKSPIASSETIEIYAFMAAAEESKKQKGSLVSLESVLNDAKE